MKFDFQRVKTPAYLTSVALVVIGLLCAVGSLAVLAWILTIPVSYTHLTLPTILLV